MLFFLLTRVLLWLLIAIILWYVLLQVLPKAYYTWLGGLLVAIILILAFINPNTELVSSAWSILSFPLKPLGLSIILLFAALRGWFKKEKADRNLVLAALMILILSSLPLLSFWLAQQAELDAIRSEQQLLQLCQAPCPVGVLPPSRQSAGVIVLLGTGTTEPAIPFRTRIQMTNTGDRIFFTSQLYWQERGRGNNPLIIISAGRRQDFEGNLIEANDIAILLQSLGIPRQNLILDATGVDVRTSALSVRQLMQRQNLGQRLILVTSALSARRTKLAFTNVGLQVISRPTDFMTFDSSATPRKLLRVEDLVPTAEALAVTTSVINEYLLTVYYFLRGWLSPVIL